MSRSGRNEKAAEYFRRAPNYSAEAIGDLIAAYQTDSESRHGRRCRMVADELVSSVKFALPEGPRLFTNVSDVMLEQWRPPYRLTSLEYKWDTALVIIHVNDGQCSCGCGPSNEAVVSLIVCEPPGGWRLLPTWARILKPPGQQFYNLLSPNIHGGTTEGELPVDWLHAASHVLSDVAQVFAALSCTNVTTELIRPNREARAARPESTLFDYHVLMIRPGAERHASDPLGGSHASPRTHLRRGHIRQHPTAGRIWVNSCVVNPTAIGTVNKDYEIVPRKK